MATVKVKKTVNSSVNQWLTVWFFETYSRRDDCSICVVGSTKCEQDKNEITVENVIMLIKSGSRKALYFQLFDHLKTALTCETYLTIATSVSYYYTEERIIYSPNSIISLEFLAAFLEFMAHFPRRLSPNFSFRTLNYIFFNYERYWCEFVLLWTTSSIYIKREEQLNYCTGLRWQGFDTGDAAGQPLLTMPSSAPWSDQIRSELQLLQHGPTAVRAELGVMLEQI